MLNFEIMFSCDNILNLASFEYSCHPNGGKYPFCFIIMDCPPTPVKVFAGELTILVRR